MRFERLPAKGEHGMQNSPPPPPGPPSGKTRIGLQENVAAALCYLTMFFCGLGIVVSLVLFLVERNSRFVRFHSMQGLLFGAVWIVAAIAYKVLYGGVGDGILGIGAFAVLLLIILILVLFVIVATVRAYQGQYYKLPVLGGLAWNVIDKPSL